jgi:integrase
MPVIGVGLGHDAAPSSRPVRSGTVVTDSYVDPKAGRITFSTFYDDWSARQLWVSGTVLAMNLAAGSATFADMSLKSIRRSHVEAWVKQMDAAGLAPGTIKTRFNNVRAVFKAAHRDRVIGTDPTLGVTLPRTRRAEQAMQIPSPQEVGCLLRAADPWFRPFVALCAFAGLRLGEAAAIKVTDINFLARQLTVTRQIQRANGSQIEIQAPKYASERTVFVADGLIGLLSAQVAATHPDRTVGSSSRRAAIRHTRTRSATGGARRYATPACRGSSSTTFGTTSPAA